MNLVMLGAPGVGKGTQALRIARDYSVPHISTGDMLRDAVARETELGMQAKTYMDAGKLVPDELVISIVRERIGDADCSNGFILDGFPRTVAQAEVLQDVLKRMNKELDMVLDIEVPEDELVHRLTQRRQCADCGTIYHMTFNAPKTEGVCDACGGRVYQRADDEKSAIKKRLEEYRNKTQPLISFYEGLSLLKVIDGRQAPDAVFADIKNTLGAVAYDN